ncbi:root phototropism protein 3-like [Manihot esculenta]|nr:root phototropism protein 3-like [Manihot esculenta]
MWESESESVVGRDYGNGVLSSSKHGIKTDGFELRGQSWYVATDIPSDLLVQIGVVYFHLHKVVILLLSSSKFKLQWQKN